VRNSTPSCFVLGVVQDIPIEALDQPVPKVADFVLFHLSEVLGMLLVFNPHAFINENDVCSFRQEDVVPSVWANVAEVICKEVLFASRTPEFPRYNEPLFTLEVFYKVFDCVERVQQNFNRRVIQNVNETLVWVNLTDGERASTRRECEAAIHEDDVVLIEQKMIITYDTGVNHQAAAAAESVSTRFGDAMGNNNTMYLHSFWLGKRNRKRLDARTIQKEPVGVFFDPPFSTKDLISGLLDRLFIPTPPGDFRFRMSQIADIFITKDDDVILKDYQQIADFFPVPTMTPRPSLVTINCGITPQAEKRTLGELRQVPLGRSSTVIFPYGVRTS
jgi:hypothetical protein